MGGEKRLTLKITDITIFLYAFYSLKTAWLAFDKIEYSPTYYYVGMLFVVLCLPFALFTLLNARRIRITKNIGLVILALVFWAAQMFYVAAGAEVDSLRKTYTMLVIVAFSFFFG